MKPSSACFPVNSPRSRSTKPSSVCLDRGFVVPANLIDGMAAGYWASLGLDAESAAHKYPRKLAGESSQEQAKLDATLREFGVRVVDHSTGGKKKQGFVARRRTGRGLPLSPLDSGSHPPLSSPLLKSLPPCLNLNQICVHFTFAAPPSVQAM